MQLIRAQVIRCCSIRRPLQETGKMLYRPNVRLLGFIAHPVNAHMPTVLRKVTPAEAAEPLAVEMGQSRHERIARRGGHRDIDAPILLRQKDFDFGFALADEPKRYRLDSSC